MKNKKIIFGITSFVLLFASCKNEKEVQAEKKVETYVVYVDSIENVAPADVKMNWVDIEEAYQMRSSEAEMALADLKADVKAQERVNISKIKYEALKAKIAAEIEAENLAFVAAHPRQQMRNELFGKGKIGDDMNFDWVNAKNILGVYQQFIHTAENNKDSYTREDWDEVKLMYEALDSRKNTVEKEGLSSSDNSKIAGLKIKFGPMLAVNRIGAKSEEAAKAKK